MTGKPLPSQSQPLIEAYGNGGFKLNEQRYDGSILIMGNHIESWLMPDWSDITVEDFQSVMQAKPLPEIMVVGCGERFEMLPKPIKQLFRHYGIPIEAMDTGTACRTYNILLGEGRRVAAALIAV